MIEQEKIFYIDEEWKKIQNSTYEVSNYGRFRRKYKHKFRYLKTFRKDSIQVIKLFINEKGKNYNVAKLVVEIFCRPLKIDEVVYHRNGIISDNRLSNMEIVTKMEAGRRTGWQAKRKSIVMLDEEGVIKQAFKGTRDAADKLFISRQTVSDYCNGKVQKPMYKLYWASKLIEEEEK